MRYMILTTIFTLCLAATAQAVGLQVHTAGTLARSVTMYSVTASAGANGTLDATTPSPQSVPQGSTTSFKFNANSGYYVSSISGCNGTTYSNSSSGVTSYTYTTGTITGACTVNASFSQILTCDTTCSGATYGCNWLRGAPTTDPTNRCAILAGIYAGSPASQYNINLESWGGWSAPSALWDKSTCVNNLTCWTENSASDGSTWGNGSGGYGELVIDMQAVRTLQRFSVFQMFSDGKTTQVYVYSHSDTSTAPLNTDAGWVQRGSVTVGAGSYSAPTISSPATFTTTPFSTRFLKVRAYNDNSLGSTGYIELKGIKAFSN